MEKFTDLDRSTIVQYANRREGLSATGRWKVSLRKARSREHGRGVHSCKRASPLQFAGTCCRWDWRHLDFEACPTGKLTPSIGTAIRLPHPGQAEVGRSVSGR